MSHGGIKIEQNLFDKGTRLETGPVILVGGRISKIIKKKKNCKKMLHDTQQTYWENYCNSLNNNSNLSQVWYNVKKMLGNAPSKKEIPTLNQNDIPMSHLLTNPTYLLKISVKSVVLTTTVVSLKYINNRLKIMIIAILQIILTIIVIVIMINLLCRKWKMQSQILTIVHMAKTG